MANAGLFAITLCLGIISVRSVVSKNMNDFKCILNITELVEEYENLRVNEVSIEESMWTGGALVLNDTINEVKANDIFMKYKWDELRKYRNNTLENPAAMHYFHAKDKIEKSKIFQIIRKMPKGANLYIHALSAVSSDWVVKNFSRTDDFTVCEFKETPTFTFRRKADYLYCEEVLKEDSYCETLQKYFDLQKLGLTDYEKKPQEMEEYYIQMFDAIRDAVYYKPVFEHFHYQMLQEMYDDNIMYAEVRTQLLELYDKNYKEYPREHTVQTLIDVVQKFKKTHKDFLGIKFIYSIVRHIGIDEVQREIEMFKKLQKKFPKHIIGLDFVGWEDYDKHLKDYLRDFIELKNENYRFYFLAGETNQQGNASDFNLYDALLLNSQRIGHGYALWKHPVIMEKVVSQSIAIEICPVSNQIMGLVTDLRNHPGGVYISENASVVISNDSPGFFGTKGLSTDFYYTIMSLASNKADLRTLKQLALNSILYSTLSEKEVANALGVFKEKWNKFLDEIVREFNTVPSNNLS